MHYYKEFTYMKSPYQITKSVLRVVATLLFRYNQ